MHRRILFGVSALAYCALLTLASQALADPIASASLTIQGLALSIPAEAQSVDAAVDVPSVVQTELGGHRNGEAVSVQGLVALGELSGPGIDSPIELRTQPGWKFQIPALPQAGTYFLSNIRLARDSGEFLQPASPSFATIHVSSALTTRVSVRRLSAQEIRDRGIPVDPANYDVYEFNITLVLSTGEELVVPFPVVVDPRTHQAVPLPSENPYALPPVTAQQPPRWTPPLTVPVELGEDSELPTSGPDPLDRQAPDQRRSIAAAVVLPGTVAVLHDFFAVGLVIDNSAPAGSSVILDSITATLQTPFGLRTVRSEPPVGAGQPVPILDANGAVALAAQAEGSAEWILEGLRPGTHTGTIEIRATWKSQGQPDIPLKGTAPFTIVVTDPRFHITFSHPDTTRRGTEYAAFAFVTNASGSTQSVRLTTGIPPCSQFGDGLGGPADLYVCRTGTTPEFVDLDDIQPGEMRTIQYRLRAGANGHVFATAGEVSDGLSASVRLTMGVSESGIPLSAATLVLPWYAQYLDPAFVDANLNLLGLGYSLATAPLTQATARFPRVIRTDVFERAVDIARAGQRAFIMDGEDLAGYADLALDFLGNSSPLSEWDALRRSEVAGRTAGAALGRRIEATSLQGASDFDDYIARFASATATRPESGMNGQFFAALVHGAIAGGEDPPFSVALKGLASNLEMKEPNEAAAGWKRNIPYGDLMQLRSGDGQRFGLLEIVGRWSEGVELSVTARVAGRLKIDLVFPGAGSEHRIAHLSIESLAAGQTVTLDIHRGDSTLTTAGAVIATAAAGAVSVTPIRFEAARQDLHLDPDGHKVSLLFNRPVGTRSSASDTSVSASDTPVSAGELFEQFAATAALTIDGNAVSALRSVYAAALQQGSRIANLSFDHVLSRNASYSIRLSGDLTDPLSGASAAIADPVVPLIDNDAPAGLLAGKVLNADNSPVSGAEVRLYTGRDIGCPPLLIEALQSTDCNPFASPPQYETSALDGSFLFEFVPRNLELGLTGHYRLRATTSSRSTALDGAVRLPGEVQRVNLVFLGRGSAEGTVRYDNGEKVAGARVVVGSTMFLQSRTATTDANGFYRIDDLPVGPLTFTATDGAGNTTYAASEIRTASQVVVQDLSIYRRANAGIGSIRGVVHRSDTGGPVSGARVAVFSQGYAVAEAMTAADGTFAFGEVPAGLVTVLLAEWSVASESVAEDFDLHADETKELTITLPVAPATTRARLGGSVVREDPLFPGDPAHYRNVAGALVKIDSGPLVAAGLDGAFAFESIPTTFAGRGITAYDPETRRTAASRLGSLISGTNTLPPIIIRAGDWGAGTIRVRLIDATGRAVASGYSVLEPGSSPFTPTGEPGVFELRDAAVRRTYDVWAVPSAAGGAFEDQFARGSVAVEYPGQIAALTLRLPGQGQVRVRLRSDIDLSGDVTLAFQAWDAGEQSTSRKVVTATTGADGWAVFDRVPAGQRFEVEAVNPVYGRASASGTLSWDGDLRDITLQFTGLSTVRGVVYAIDRVTPVAGATVRLRTETLDYGAAVTSLDGSFEFAGVGANSLFTVTASASEAGIDRVGFGGGRTPEVGGDVDDVRIVLLRRGSVEGRIVYAGYDVFDPANPSNNVPDSTPADLSDNAPVPLARLYLRELNFPARSFGSPAAPLTVDAGGRFTVSVFEGPIRATVWSSANQELRASWTGTIGEEGEALTPIIAIGTEGIGSAAIVVRDPNEAGHPVANAEVSLYRSGSLFDFGSTDAHGVVRFEQLPAVTYRVSAYAKSLAKSGDAAAFDVVNGDEAVAEIMLTFAGKVSGRVSDPELAGTPGVAGAHVTLTATNYQTRATSEASGAFAFDGIREGALRLDTKDPLSNRRATASRILTQELREVTGIDLQLEPVESLHVMAFLPDDTGGNSGIAASLAAIEVTQRCTRDLCDFRRALQGNPFVVDGLFENAAYDLVIAEVGGEGRRIAYHGAFPAGSAASPLPLVFPAFGSVEVHILQGSAPAANARVTVSGGGKTATVFTDSSGAAVAPGIGLGTVYVQVVSADGRFSASGSVPLTRQSVPAEITLTLGDYTVVTGLVDAEAGGPSIGTRVILGIETQNAETRTDGDGRFIFRGVALPPSGGTVTLTYLGPNDATIGARQTLTIVPLAGQPFEAPAVRLDATPPQILSIEPPDGAQNVSPDSVVRVTFSEPVDPSQLTSSLFRVFPADGSAAPTASVGSAPGPNGTFIVTFTPAPAQPFPLRSNTLYSVAIDGAVRDLSGHTIPAPRGSTFTTSDYAEPRIIRIDPLPGRPIPRQTTFRFTFNEPIQTAQWQPGGGGVFELWKVSAIGARDGVQKAGAAYVDPSDGATLVFAPESPIEESSFYRVYFTGARDLQGNAATAEEVFFTSYDSTAPAIAITAPPAAEALTSGAEYTAQLTTAATDIEKVDWFEIQGGIPVYRKTITFSPFSYRFVAPSAPAEGSALALRAIATDFSGNESDPADATWTVVPNAPPQNLVIALMPSQTYPGKKVSAAVSFDDEGTFATIQLTASGVLQTGGSWSQSFTREVTRASTSAVWASTSFDVDLSPLLSKSSAVAFAAAVTDVHGLKSTTTAMLDTLPDDLKPSLLSITPASETRFENGDKYQVEAAVRDDETGVVEVDFIIDGDTVAVAAGSSNVSPGTEPGTLRFRSGEIVVPVKNTDTRIRIETVARDYQGNSVSGGVEIVYVGVNDPTIPKGAWLCPLDHAILPAGRVGFPLTARIHATDDIAVAGVKVRLPDGSEISASPISGTSDYQASIVLDTPAAGETVTLTGIVSDADLSHDVVLPITVDAVAVDIFVDSRVQAVTASDAPSYENRTILVTGAGAKLVPHVGLNLANLIVLDGGRIETTTSTAAAEERVDLTLSGSLYVDCNSSVDVSGRGYPGGWGVATDGNRNERSEGLTRGGVPGTSNGASGSYAGLGSAESNATNAPYGSLRDPRDLGSGGAGSASCCNAGGAGGGAIRVAANDGRLVIAGSMRADGETGIGRFAAGSGGSIGLSARQIITGPATRIIANGGDDDGANGQARGAGGGRIAVSAAERLELPDLTLQLQARSGRNGTSIEGSTYLDGGAGTVWLQRPGAAAGELIVSSFDDRYPSSTHLTRPTPVRTQDGELAFDALTVGPRALVRVDDSIAVAGAVNDRSAATIDPTAVLLLSSDVPSIDVTATPPDGNLIQGSSLSVTYAATSPAGVRSVALAWSPVTPDRVDTYPASPPEASPESPVLLAVPDATPLGDATLTARATDRAERSAASVVRSYTVLANAPPSIERFDVAPLEIYPGHGVSAVVSASDDVAVKTVTLAATIGSGSPSLQSISPNATPVTDHVFTVPVAVTTPGAQALTLDLGVDDGFTGRTPLTASKTISILKDSIAPSLSVTSPAADTLFDEGAGNTITVTATAFDAEVAVKEVFVQVDGGAPMPLTRVGTTDQFSTNIPVPAVEGSDIVTKQLVVTAKDYEGNAAVSPAIPIRIKPLFDPNAPVVSFTCASSGAMYPPGYQAKLRVLATRSATSDPSVAIQKVEFFAGEDSTAIPATKLTSPADNWEATWTVPALADGTDVPIRAVATTNTGSATTISSTVTVVSGVVITSDTTISTNQYDGQTLIVQAGTTTLSGARAFARLAVLGTGKLTHAQAGNIDLNVSGSVFFECTASIDVTGRGYAQGQGYPGATTSTGANGGSHLGYGGAWSNGTAGSVFGSVYSPREPGGFGYTGGAGGGVITILGGDSVTVDGALRANGAGGTTGGAGGSVWIKAGSVSGAGSVETRGESAGYGTGGGGAVAIEYASGAAPQWAILARAGAPSSNNSYGGAGTVWMRGPESLYGDLIIDDGSITSGAATELPSLGSGVAQPGTAGSVLVTDRAANIPSYFEGHSVEIRDSEGSLKGTWPIKRAGINGKSIELDGSVGLQPGDGWAGVYRFDSIIGRTPAVVRSNDRIVLGPKAELKGPASAGQWFECNQLLTGSEATDATVSGRVAIRGYSGRSLDIASDGVLSHPTGSSLTLTVGGDVAIESGGLIDASGRGYAPGQGYPGATKSTGANGGSHLGFGGPWNNGVAGSVFGSVCSPREAGGSGSAAGIGGGIVIAMAGGDFRNDGVVRANGSGGTIGGAGGSIWIRAQSVSGTGLVEARGESAGYGTGGGGAVAIEYAAGPAPPWAVVGRAGSPSSNNAYGGAGTMWIAAPGSSYGALTVDNSPITNGAATELPALGSGRAEAGTAGPLLVTDRSASIPAYLEGHWVEIRTPDGTLKGTWRVKAGSISAKTVTLEPNGVEPIDIQPGDTWLGVYRFDNLKLTTSKLQTRDRLVVTNPVVKDSSSTLTANLDGPPRINAALVSISGAPNASTVAGSAGAIADDNAAVTVTVINERSGATAATTMLAGGSFTATIGGLAGDPIAVRAKDGHVYSMQSGDVLVGTLPNIPAVDISKIAITISAPGGANVTGSAGAVIGEAPLTVELRNATAGASVPSIPVAADGSFAASIAAVAGEALELTATNASGISNGPISIGIVPFGSSVSYIPITAAQTDANFRANTLAADGDDLFVVHRSLGDPESAKAVIFDVSDPGNPTIRRITSAGVTGIYDVAVRDGWAFIASYDFATLDLRSSTATAVTVPASGGETAVAVDGAYAFTAANTNGTIRIYDVTTPSAPRLLREQTTISGIVFRDLLALGKDYLVGIAPERTGSGTIGHDVVVIDRRDVNNLRVIADRDIPGMDAFRGRLRGSSLVVVGTGQMAIVDLSQPAAPLVKAVRAVDASSSGADLVGGRFFAAERSAGRVGVFDLGTDGSLSSTGAQLLSGSPADVLPHRGVLYVANESGLAVIPDVEAPPMVDPAAISVSKSDSSHATVQGQPWAVMSRLTTSVIVHDATTGADVSGIAVDSGGGFPPTAIDANSGDAMAVTATDSASRSNGPVSLGSVPVVSATGSLPITTAMSDSFFRGRALALEGSVLAMTDSRAGETGGSPRMLVFDASTNPPSWTRTIALGADPLQDIDLTAGWACVASADFKTVQATSATPTVQSVAVAGSDLSVAVSGTTAFAGSGSGDGKLRLYDIANPAAPAFAREQVLVSGISYWDLAVLDATHLVAVSPQTVSGVGHDLVVIDSSNPANLITAADFDVPQFDAYRGRVDGSMVYLAGRDKGIAIVNLTVPSSPAVLSIIDTPGIARDIAVVRPGLIAVADGCSGITFVDVSDPAAPRVIGTQPVLGNAWAVASSGGVIYAATEQLLETFTLIP